MKVLPFAIQVPHDHSIIVQEETRPHFYTYLHRHAEVQVTWVQKGRGTLLAGNTMHITDPEGMRIAAVYNYIIQNYSSTLTLEEVAAQAHLTPTAFCRYFKKHTRHTFVHFVNRIRVNEACRQLASGSQNSIAAVAYGCGFNSITNFNYIFKSITGMAPREYMAGYGEMVRRG